MVDGVAHEPGTAVEVAGTELGALGDVVGAGAVVGAGVVEGAAALGRHWLVHDSSSESDQE